VIDTYINQCITYLLSLILRRPMGKDTRGGSEARIAAAARTSALHAGRAAKLHPSGSAYAVRITNVYIHIYTGICMCIHV